MKSRLTSVLFSSHAIENREEKNVETNTEEVENEDEVWSQFKRKESSDRLGIISKILNSCFDIFVDHYQNRRKRESVE